MNFPISTFTLPCEAMSKDLLLGYFLTGLSNAHALMIFHFFFNISNLLNFNFAMRCYWARADLFVSRMVTLAGYTVLFGHLV